MKILHVCKKYPRALGGDAVVVSSLCKQQQAAGHEVAIATSNCDEITNEGRIYKLGLRDTPSQLDRITFRRLVSLVGLFFSMFIVLFKERPAVIHAHSIDMTFFASFAARFYRIPLVHTFHIVTFYDPTQSVVRRKTEIWLAKKAGLRCTTAPNLYDVKKLQAAGLTQTVLLPNGVDTEFWGAIARGNEEHGFTFVTVGRLEQQKGYKYLIKAVALLARTSRQHFHVVIIGEGAQAASLRTLARSLHVENIVTFVGRRTQGEIRTLLQGAGAAIFPSLYETTPITLLEAWAAGVPVIITPVGILHDKPADFQAAYIVPPRNEDALMRTMKRCMAEVKTRLSVAIKGQEEAQKYSWPIVSRRAETIYRNTQ